MPISNTKNATKKQQPKLTNKPESTDEPERKHWVAESAYFIAESRGFIPGLEQEDWKIAEEKYETTYLPVLT